MFGPFLIILGIYFLMEEMGLIQGNFLGYFWPILLIILGIKMMNKDKSNANCFSFWSSNGKNNSKHKHDKVVDDQ